MLFNSSKPKSIIDNKEIQTINYGNATPSATTLISEDNRSYLRIRKLTPLECFRLMGYDDSDFYKAKNIGISDTQLYRQARK